VRNRTTKKRRSGLGLFVVLSTLISTQLASQPTLAATEPEWLTVLNLYRATAGLAPGTENPAASQGSRAHTSYLLTNRSVGSGEAPDTPGYSQNGVRADATGIVSNSSGAIGQRQTIERWMTTPFKGLALIEPYAQPYGYGLEVRGSRWVSTLSHSWDSYRVPGSSAESDPLRLAVAAVERAYPEVSGSNMFADLRGVTLVVRFEKRRFLVVGESIRELRPDERAFPTVVWPGNGSSVPLVRNSGVDSSDLINACEGWTLDAGLPILIHRSVITLVNKATLTDTNGAELEVCSIDFETIVSPDSEEQTEFEELIENDAILIPRKPLTPGHSYKVHVELLDEVLDWTFGTTTDGSIKLPPGSPLEGRTIPGVPLQPVKAAKPAKKSPSKPAVKSKVKAKS
jgi:hypothetical protein